MPKVECTCLECGVKFLEYPSDIKRGRGKYCKICRNKSKKVELICQSCGKKFLEYQYYDRVVNLCEECRNKSKKVELICQSCGKKFLEYPSNIKRGRGKYCEKCRHRKSKKVECICLNCGVKFFERPSAISQRINTGKYCEKCRHRKSKKVEIICQSCGKTRLVPLSCIINGRGVYCSRKCASKHISDKNKVKKNCKICGREFYIIKSRSMSKNTCLSKKCEILWMSISRSGENGSNWQGGLTNLNTSIRKCHKMKEWRRKVFERDGYKDAITGEKGYLHPHHKKHLCDIVKDNNITTFEEALLCKELWDIGNGITLTKENHMKNFHGVARI